MRVIGTAGHVDHGKSTLVAALTGTHPDRLKEEQAREMTIELGFGWMTLPGGEEIGIVDVPGHRDFIENMLAGVGGIDAALLVIAADEGVMPQTREHLAILDLLQIPGGLVVLTKTDLVSESAWLDLVESDVRAAIRGTVLENSPVIRVSARTGFGLDVLISGLESGLRDQPSRLDLSRPRLPIDRVFSMSGFGTVVTGTLLDGQLSLGDDVEILPSGRRGRVRGLQTHRQNEETAVPGSRTAVNISGVETASIQRGEVVVRPGQYQPTRRIDARFRLLRDASVPLTHNTEVKFFVGASETMATVRLLGTEELKPGEEGWIQLELRDPIVTVRGDRYILRRPSPGETLGGGVIVDHQPGGRHRRFDEGALRSLELLRHGAPKDVLIEAALTLQIASIRDVVNRSRLESAAARSALSESLADGSLILLQAGTPDVDSTNLIMARPQWNALLERIQRTVEAYHRDYPLRRGVPREELRSRLGLAAPAANGILDRLIHERLLADHGMLIAMPDHVVRFDEPQAAKVEALMRRFDQSPFSPPGASELQAEVGEEIQNALLESGELVAVSPEVLFRKQEYEWMTDRVRKEIRDRGSITLSQVRDLFGTSRKYAQAFLEHLDGAGVTVRIGDVRKLKSK